MTLVLNDNNFDELIKSGIVVVDFWAEWCGPCKQFKPIIEKLSEDLKDKVLICTANVEEVPSKATELNIRSIPTIVLYKDGQKVETLSGAKPYDEMKKWISTVAKIEL